MRTSVLLPVVLVAISAATTRAATPAEKQQALEHVASGKRHYNLSEFAEALSDYKEAYRLTDDPNLLFNLGQCQWKLGDDRNALHSYRAYLRNGSDPANRAQVEIRIAEIEKKLKASEQLSADRVAAEKAAQNAAADRAAAEKAARAAADERAAAERLIAAGALANGAAQDKAASEKAAAERAASAAEKTASAAEKTADVALAQPKTLPVAVALPEAVSPRPSVDVSRPPRESDERRPFYTQWWFWTAAGVVAAGAAITVILLATGGTESATRGDLGAGLVVIP